jgi:alpha-tubulin suppressor-like RCC1 family protein
MKKLLFFMLLLQHSVINAQCYTDIQLGTYHVVGIRTNNTVWGWGTSGFGQLGLLGNFNPSPLEISNLTDWSKIFAGGANTFIIKNNGTLWGLGTSNYGQLGTGSSSGVNASLQQIGTGTNWLKIAPTVEMTIALKTNGTIWGWGQTDDYELGNNLCCANQLTPIQIGTDSNWVDIETGFNAFSFAIKNNGGLWGWGFNIGGVLGQGSSTVTVNVPTQIGTATNWSKLNAGSSHILALKTDQTLWSWGGGGSGQTGDGLNPMLFRNTPRQIGTETWKEVVAGNKVSFGIKTNGTLWGWGLNDAGQLGLGNTSPQVFPTQIGTANDWAKIMTDGFYTVMAIKNDGAVYMWGSNQTGVYGNGTLDNNFTVPTLIPNICASLSATELSLPANGIQLYPNPAKEMVSISYSLNEKANISLYDLSGRLLQQHTTQNIQGEWQCNTSQMPAGVYIVVVQNENGNLWQEKLIIQ